MATVGNSWNDLATAGPAPGSSTGNQVNADASNAEKQGTNPLTGFASRYDPSQLEQIWQSPWAILPDVFPGMNLQGPGYQGLRDIGADPLTLYNIMAGRSDSLGGGTATGNYTNWLADLMKSYGTKGGRSFAGNELLHALFNPKGGEGAGTQSALYNILTAGDAGTQMRTLFNMARDASNVGLNPLAARGYQSALARAGDQAQNAMLNSNANQGANNEPVFQYIREHFPGLIGG